MKTVNTHIVLELLKPVMPKSPVDKVFRKVYELENGKYLIEREEETYGTKRMQHTGAISPLSKEDFKEMEQNLKDELI
jgi:hypothetical protein